MNILINIARSTCRFVPAVAKPRSYQCHLQSYIRLRSSTSTYRAENDKVVSQKFTRKLRHNKLLEVRRAAMADPATAAILGPLQAFVKEQVITSDGLLDAGLLCFNDMPFLHHGTVK